MLRTTMQHPQMRVERVGLPACPVSMSAQVFAPWPAGTALAWNRRAMCLQHHLHQHPVLQMDALARLIERYPRQDYALVHTSRQGDGRARWREGDIAGVGGEQVIQTIAQGSLWLNMRQVNTHGAEYEALLQQAYAEIAAQVPGFQAGAFKMGILISSPNAQVHYHCDLPGQLLWQIHGRKRVWLYPTEPPCLQPQWLEDIAYTGFEFSLVYDPAFDRMAQVFEIGPGEMLSWPLNAPHRVQNLDCLNVSVTTEHWSAENLRAQKVHVANALLRHRLGWQPRSRALSGPGYWAKVALQAAWRRSPLAARTRTALRPLEFKLDASAPGTLVELGQAAAGAR